MVTAVISEVSNLIDGVVADVPTLFAVLVPFVVGILLFTIAKKWFFGGTRRI